MKEQSNARLAGILCNNPDFQEYLGATCPESAAAALRRQCGIASRCELDTSPEAARKFHALRREFAYREDPRP